MSQFLTIPAECRVLVYIHLFLDSGSSSAVDVTVFIKRNQSIPVYHNSYKSTSILRVSRQISNEALNELFRVTQFSSRDGMNLSSTLISWTGIGTIIAARMRSLNVEIDNMMNVNRYAKELNAMTRLPGFIDFICKVLTGLEELHLIIRESDLDWKVNGDYRRGILWTTAQIVNEHPILSQAVAERSSGLLRKGYLTPTYMIFLVAEGKLETSLKNHQKPIAKVMVTPFLSLADSDDEVERIKKEAEEALEWASKVAAAKHIVLDCKKILATKWSDISNEHGPFTEYRMATVTARVGPPLKQPEKVVMPASLSSEELNERMDSFVKRPATGAVNDDCEDLGTACGVPILRKQVSLLMR